LKADSDRIDFVGYVSEEKSKNGHQGSLNGRSVASWVIGCINSTDSVRNYGRAGLRSLLWLLHHMSRLIWQHHFAIRTILPWNCKPLLNFIFCHFYAASFHGTMIVGTFSGRW